MATLPPPTEDGLPAREAGPWVKDKLAIVEYYLPAFGVACSGTPGWYYVDPFAGSGVNVIRDSGERVWGTPLIALSAEPPFRRCLLIEINSRRVRALRQRTSAFGERAIVERGQCNVDLIRLMGQHVEPKAPILCLLDPEGMEVDWATIEQLAVFKTGRYKVEILILFNADGPARFKRRHHPGRVFPRPSHDAD